MPNDYFEFKQFVIKQNKTAMKVGTDSVVFGAAVAVYGTETKILDIGTGTGLLALMAAQRTDKAEITAVEIDPSACEQAMENVANSKWHNRIRIVNCDINAYKTDERFDLIISNPPYFAKSMKSQNREKNFARHDEALTLNDLVERVSELLSENGRFALILPEERIKSVIELAACKKLFPIRQLNIKPTEDKPVNRVILEFSHNETRCEEKFLSIRSAAGTYSDEYKNLTAKFYLMINVF